MVKAYISMGSNQGSPKENLREALQRMNEVRGIRVLRAAPLYLTEPVGYEDQEWFHNTVAEVETSLEPRQLLSELQNIENHMGRVRTIRWGPRTLDLDIILFGDRRVEEPDLEIPHPRFTERAFVLAPLRDLNPGMVLPSGSSVEQALEKLMEKKYICTEEKMW